MASELVFLDRAREDLRELSDYLFSLSPQAAQRYVIGIEEACGRLRMFPRAGRAYDDVHRVLVYRNHLIFYRVSEVDAKVSIVSVIDGRRDPQSHGANLLT